MIASKIICNDIIPHYFVATILKNGCTLASTSSVYWFTIKTRGARFVLNYPWIDETIMIRFNSDRQVNNMYFEPNQ
jgi:hypothetical protein